MTASYDVVGYVYNADTYCPMHAVEAIGRRMVADGSVNVTTLIDSAPADDWGVELDWLASMLGINRADEATFDSGDFPKVIFADSIIGVERCVICGEAL